MDKIKFKKMNLILTALIAMLLNLSCHEEVIIDTEQSSSGAGLSDWATETHSNDVDPNYDVVFPQDKVNRIDIVLSSDEWDAMLQDMTDNLGEFGSGGGNPPPPPPMFKSFMTEDFTPIFQPASVFMNGLEWYNVGVRFKGNSSLRSTWSMGCYKFAFRFDFDEFEDTYPEINNQRFYGFKKLAFSNNFNDKSFLHEKVAADIFRASGIPAPQTAYYAIYVDYGDGPTYFGLYTGVEIVEDTMLDEQFSDGSGNCYKPEGDAATFAEGTFNTEEFDLKTNEDAANYSDVQLLYETLNSELRNTDVEQWKTNLESILDVDAFMHWLAVNTTIQNWDTYGIMNHNYYLYFNPTSQKLVWIPWDNNEALSDFMREPLPLNMSVVTSDWPLIDYLFVQEDYKEIYKNYLLETINGAFNPSDIQATYEYYHNLIADYVDAEQEKYTFLMSPAEFTNSLNDQNNHVQERYDAVMEYLGR
ncbi:MAG: spore coat protein [Salinivirgaceae bacterium]|nr:MAG: spore coat protein [Salinivirgaceae bacterium]